MFSRGRKEEKILSVCYESKGTQFEEEEEEIRMLLTD